MAGKLHDLTPDSNLLRPHHLRTDSRFRGLPKPVRDGTNDRPGSRNRDHLEQC